MANLRVKFCANSECAWEGDRPKMIRSDEPNFEVTKFCMACGHAMSTFERVEEKLEDAKGSKLGDASATNMQTPTTNIPPMRTHHFLETLDDMFYSAMSTDDEEAHLLLQEGRFE